MTIGISKPKREVNEELLEKVRAQACCVCGAAGPSDPSHIKTRGSGGGDFAWNIFPKCRIHHIEWGQIGWYRFLGRYPRFSELLLDAGWEIDWFGHSLHHGGLR